jgi:hypothetical protein
MEEINLSKALEICLNKFEHTIKYNVVLQELVNIKKRISFEKVYNNSANTNYKYFIVALHRMKSKLYLQDIKNMNLD